MKNIEWKILSRSITGDITEDERQALNAWLADKEENREYYNNLKSYISQDKAKDIGLADSREQFMQHLKASKKISNPRIRIMRLLPYAAVLVVIFAITMLITDRTDNKQIAESHIVTAEETSNEVRLIAGSGKKYDLTHSGDIDSVEKHENIKADKAIVDYSSGSVSAKPAKQVEYHKLIVPAGAKYTLMLPDGSRVFMNSKSEIEYPNAFIANQERKVKLKGEAYFEVKHSSKSPFIVVSDNISIRNYGTSYNVNSREENKNIEVTLVEGSISVTTNILKKEQFVKPNQTATYQKSDKSIKIVEADLEKVLGWRNGLFAFEYELLSNIIQELYREYNIAFYVEDESILKERFTAYVPRLKDFRKVLKIMENSGEFKFEIKDKKVILLAQ